MAAGQHSGALLDLLSSIMAPPEASEAPLEKSVEELAKMSKGERAGYHQARLAVAKAQDSMPEEALSKAERRTISREKQDKDRSHKMLLQKELGSCDEALAELKMQGLDDAQARAVLAQIEEAEAAGCRPGDDEDEDEDESLIDSVRNWMSAQTQSPTSEESLRDFNLKVRFQGHVETTPPDHLSAILRVLCSQVCADLDWAHPPRQPSEVATRAGPMLVRWAFLLGELYRRCDVLEITEMLVSSVHEGITDATEDVPDAARSIALVGFLMAMRAELDCVSDEDILAGCHQLESEDIVVQKFITFLTESLESSDGSGSGSEG